MKNEEWERRSTYSERKQKKKKLVVGGIELKDR